MASTVTMRQDRAKLIADARSILDAAAASNRDVTAEEQRAFDKLMKQVDQLGAAIEREEQLFQLEAALAKTKGGPPFATVGAGSVVNTEERGLACPEVRAALTLAKDAHYRAAFWRAIRNRYAAPADLEMLSSPETRALTVGVNVSGGFLVPDDFERRVIVGLALQGAMRAAATVMTLANDRQIPVVADEGAAAWVGEGGTFPESNPTFAQRLLGAHKMGRLVQVSEELLQDSAVDVEAFLAAAFSRSFGVLEELAFVNGTGVGQPRGILLDAPIGITAAAAAAITGDELIRLFHALPAPYRSRASWVMHDGTALAVRLLKDTTGQYLWQPGLQAGQPDRLLGRPVLTSAGMPAMAAGARSVLFADLSYYWIADRAGMVLQRLVEIFATSGRVGFRMFRRTDGVLTVTDSARVIRHP